eukprot:g7311.t1
MKRNTSAERLQKLVNEASNSAAKLASADGALGPTQRQQLSGVDPNQRSLSELLVLTAMWFLLTCFFMVMFCSVPLDPRALAGVFTDVMLFRRTPFGTTDGAAVLAAIANSLPCLILADRVFRRLTSNAGARWFLLHSFANLWVVVLGAPDMIYSFWRPLEAMSTEYCVKLNGDGYPFACSDWPKAIIVALHTYHALAFRLSSEDIFHHLLFVPVIAGFGFLQQWGSAENVLAFFISGLPGGIDYLLLGLVKMGVVHPILEKRWNCSINTWLRAPGINLFCVLALCAWCNPAPNADPPAAWCFLPVVVLSFFNGQYYAQRVVGNYYIKKTLKLGKDGITHVDLHAS